MSGRRAFLQTIGAAAVALVAPYARAERFFRAPTHEFELTPAGLKAAIERLFPAGHQYSKMAYEEFYHGAQQPIQPGEIPLYGLPVQRVVHVCYALGYEVTEDPARDKRLMVALFYSMFNAMLGIAENPSNRNAVLIWRQSPMLMRGRRADDDRPEILQISMRVGLRQTGWRERCGVPACYDADVGFPVVKPNWKPVYVIERDAVV